MPWTAGNADHADARPPRSARLLRRFLTVFGRGRRLRNAGHSLRVLLAGLRGVLFGLVRLILRGFAHGDLLGCGYRHDYPGGAAATLLVKSNQPTPLDTLRRADEQVASSCAPARDVILLEPGPSGGFVHR